MAKKAEAVETATVAALKLTPSLAHLAALSCALLALLSFNACSILPAEHEPGPTKGPSIRLITREPNRLTFKFVAWSKPGAAPAGLTLWLGDKEHTVVSMGSERGTTMLEYTPDGVFWTAEWPPESAFGKPAHMRSGPMPLTDLAFRPDPLVPDADGRLPIADAARPGQPKLTIYLSISDCEPTSKF